MKIGFYLTYSGNPKPYALADILVRSVRRTMPKVPVFQLTDETSPALSTIDGIIRKPKQPLPQLRSTLFASCTGDWLFVDTDIVFLSGVEHVFDVPFDIAVADRNWPHAPVAAVLKKMMPYNVGVIFSRSTEFWRDINLLCTLSPAHSDEWFGDQKAICDLIGTDKYKTFVLPGLEYNYPPIDRHDPAKGARIVHCKGDRKEWMLCRSA
jgi:hypothetical protein